jgi:hypothetical protein
MPAKVLLFNEEARSNGSARRSSEPVVNPSLPERPACNGTLNRLLHGRLDMTPIVLATSEDQANLLGLQIYLASTGQLTASGVPSLLRSRIKRAGGLVVP